MYIFKNTEITTKKASDFETKSMLFLIGMRADSNEIETIAVDCFNDVTGLNANFDRLWDVQSKNHRTMYPSKIGESLFTLYKNYVSSFGFFYEFILFVPKLNRDYLIDKGVNVYTYSNINKKQKRGIEKKLKEVILDSCCKLEYNKNPCSFRKFLHKVIFVEDNNTEAEYIKGISNFKNKRAISNDIYESIFYEIRDKQSSLKNSFIEGEQVTHPSQVIAYKRHLQRSDINVLLISRLVGVDVFTYAGVPPPFMSTVLKLAPTMDGEDVSDIIQECNSSLSRAFFDKNKAKLFWSIVESIVNNLKARPSKGIQICYEEVISENSDFIDYLDQLSFLYLISMIKSGVDNADQKNCIW